jgi:hypothetical protein
MASSIRGSNVALVTTHYAPVRIPRPESGVVAHRMLCPSCYEAVTWKVLSKARTARARHRWLLIGLAGPLALIGVIVAFNVTAPSPNPNPVLVWLGVILSIVGPVAGLTGFLIWFLEQGVRVPERRHRPGRPRRGIPHVQ